MGEFQHCCFLSSILLVRWSVNTGKVEESGILILIPYCLVLSRFFSINFCVEKLVPLVLI